MIQSTQPIMAYFSQYWRHAVLGCCVLVSIVWIFSLDVIAQDLTYHQFADGRDVLFIPNFMDLVSNLPFLIVGLLGVRFCLGREQGEAQIAWCVFFVGISLVSLGSAYYHFNPNNSSLLWDRLPMTLGFMGLFTALIKERLDQRVGQFILVPAITLGLFSVLYWYVVDDLRLYYWVQLLPIVTVPLVVLLFKRNSCGNRYLLMGLGFYLLAKVAEHLDWTIYQVTYESVSGHTLKHLLAAGACYSILLMLKRRQ